MKTKEEIEQLAQEWFLNDKSLAYGEEFGFIKGYTQCQEEMADKKYTEEDIMKAVVFGYRQNGRNGHIDDEEEKEFINSLNKQDNEN
jgi:hypothetical protein